MNLLWNYLKVLDYSFERLCLQSDTQGELLVLQYIFGVVILETRLRTDVIVSMVANGCNKLIGATQTFFDSQPDSSVG